MSTKLNLSPQPGAVILSFRDRFASSPQFSTFFQEGMFLVEETAEYLDVQGRHEAKKLTPPVSLTYTTESMALTTRLMQIASWLILRRAIANGEVTLEQAQTHKRRVRLAPQSSARGEGFDGLPPKLRYLIQESHRLHDRILRLECLIFKSEESFGDASPVDMQVDKIRLAFSA